MPKEHCVEEDTDRRSSDTHRDQGGGENGPVLLDMEVVIEPGHEEGDRSEGEVEDARGHIGDDQSGRSDGVDPAEDQPRYDELEHLSASPPARVRFRSLRSVPHGGAGLPPVARTQCHFLLERRPTVRGPPAQGIGVQKLATSMWKSPTRLFSDARSEVAAVQEVHSEKARVSLRLDDHIGMQFSPVKARCRTRS